MEKRKIYVDYNATTPLHPAVKAYVIENLDNFGNASSMHTSGRLARTAIEKARESAANLIGAKDGRIIFTSGGSEANNMVFQTIRHLSKTADRNEIITTAIEHPCVLNCALNLKKEGFNVKIIPVDEYGKVRIDDLKNILSEKTLFVSVMAANNEIGTIQDFAEITALVKKHGALMHIDAVQAVGKIKVNVQELAVDYLTVSAHKIYGPKGVGALYVKNGAKINTLIHGGHQEDGFRAGTYNNFGILGFGKACELAALELDRYAQEMSALRDMLKEGLLEKIPAVKVNGHPKDVLPNTLNVSFPGAEGEAILLSLDMAGIEASTGSACASGSLEPSHVLMATGVGPELAHGSIRFSLGWGITKDDINYIINETAAVIERLRSMSTF